MVRSHHPSKLSEATSSIYHAAVPQKPVLKGPVCEIKQPLQDGKHIAEKKMSLSV